MKFYHFGRELLGTSRSRCIVRTYIWVNDIVDHLEKEQMLDVGFPIQIRMSDETSPWKIKTNWIWAVTNFGSIPTKKIKEIPSTNRMFSATVWLLEAQHQWGSSDLKCACGSWSRIDIVMRNIVAYASRIGLFSMVYLFEKIAQFCLPVLTRQKMQHFKR